MVKQVSITNRNAEEKAVVSQAPVVAVANDHFNGLNPVNVLTIPEGCSIRELAITILEPFDAGVSLQLKDGTTTLLTMTASTSSTNETSPQQTGNSVVYTPTGRKRSSSTGKTISIDPSGVAPTKGKAIVEALYTDNLRGTGIVVDY